MITVITATGGRPEAFALAERWMSRQTYRGEMQWLIVDDCEPVTRSTIHEWTDRSSMRLETTRIRPEPRWKPGDNTLARNLLAAFPHVRHDKVVFIEDDDFYAPGYLQAMSYALDMWPLVGEVPARYYNILTRQWWTGGDNPRHASLCQTAMRAELIPELAELCKRRRDHIDINFWRDSTTAKKGWVQAAGCIGIKGLPGRPGIGMGHRPRAWWPHDPDGRVLRSWIGEDAAVYWRFQKDVQPVASIVSAMLHSAFPGASRDTPDA